MVINSMFYACDVCPHKHLSLIYAEQGDSCKKVILAQNIVLSDSKANSTWNQLVL